MNINTTRRVVTSLVACGVVILGLSVPASAARTASREDTSELNDSVARRSEVGVLLPSLVRDIVQVPSESIEDLTAAARALVRPTGAIEPDHPAAEASLSIRARQPADDVDQRTTASYPAQLINAATFVSPLGPVIEHGAGEERRKRMDVRDDQ